MTDSDLSLELDIACPIVARPLGSLSSSVSQLARVQDLATTLVKPISFAGRTPSSSHLLCFNQIGSLWLRTSSSPGTVFIPPGTLFFVRSGTRVTGMASRGDHRLTLLNWHSSLSTALENWITSKAGSRMAPTRVMAYQAIKPRLTVAVQRFQESLKIGLEEADPFFISSIFELCGALLSNQDLLRLTGESNDPAEPLRDLIHAVREEPTAPWPLPEAATRAGYSPFHFSRVFKGAIGCGFHEYVERCRTELAIEMLISTANPVELIANSAGFGTPQSLRDAMKSFTGFVPSELRCGAELTARYFGK